MKLLLLVLVTLLAPAAFAAELPCRAVLQQEIGPAVYLTTPYLEVKSEGGFARPMPFAFDFDEIGQAPTAEFGANLCRSCGWGTSSTALQFGGFSAPYVAFLDQEGKLKRLGRSSSGREIDSLTCTR